MNNLTTQQQRVLMWLTQYQKKNLTTPSFADMAEAFGVSINTIGQHIKQLEEKGAINRNPHAKRRIEVVAQKEKANE